MALSSPATVLVYKGTGSHFTPTAPLYSAKEGAYLIVDLAAKEMTLIFYGTLNHKLNLLVAVNQGTLDEGSVPSTGTRTYEVFAEVLRQTSGPAFGDQVAMFRGLETTVDIAGSPGNFSTGMHPKTLAGIYRYFGEGFGSSYDEHGFSLSLDQDDTLNSNNGTLGIAAVQSDIIARLETLGYQQ